MSELSELIKINKNIEKQNNEIIRLLKKIAGEEDKIEKTATSLESLQKEFASEDFDYNSYINDIILKDIDKTKSEPKIIEFKPDESKTGKLSTTPDVGEVYFIEDKNIFKLTIENNEVRVNNLTGSSDKCNYYQQELVAKHSIKINQATQPSTVILNKDQSTNLPETLKICYDEGARYVFLPWYSMTQLVGAPDELMKLLKLTFYKNDEELIEKVFEIGD